MKTMRSNITILIAALVAVLTWSSSACAVTDVYNTAGSFTWTCPAGVSSATVEVWGAGGGGANDNTKGNGSSGGGGGGGAYAKSVIAVTPSTGYAVVVGAAGAAGAAGGSSSFDTAVVVAEGGQPGVIDGNGGAGGTVTTGDVFYSGGNGFSGAGIATGGGGGSSAGTGSNGNNASSATGALAVTGGGPGGNAGGAGEVNGNPPGSGPGGGGGGSGEHTAQGGNSGGAGFSGKVLITYTVASPDTLTATNNPVASSGSPSELDVVMQYLQVASDNVDNGAVIVTSVTVDDIGTAVGGDIDFINVYMDNDADIGNGNLGKVATAFAGTQLNVDLIAGGISEVNRTVSNPTSKYIIITYDLNAGVVDGTQLQSSVSAIGVDAADTAPSGAPWNSNNFATSSGPSDTLADCGGCHNYFPASMDALSRDAATGKFVGDHDKHNAYTCDTCHVDPGGTDSSFFAHRNGNLEMASGSIGVGADDGVYDVKGSTFAQDNAPTTSTCSLVDCHNNNQTPQWGAAGPFACDMCHALPPNTNAHTTHYTAKGWATGVTTNCVYCHPDNTSGGHSDVTDNSILYNTALTIAGNPAPDVTCANTDIGCHNGNTSPNWVTGGTITCTQCHSVGGANTATVANPVSGLHGNVVASVQDHDDTLTGGCEACHDKAALKTAGHWNGAAGGTTPDYTKAQVGITKAMYTDAGGTGATRGTCMGTTDLSGCHTDGGEWRRQWSTNADVDIVASPLPGQAVCNVCHGQFSTITNSTGWNEGTVHFRSGSGAAEDKGAIHTDAGDECEDCHGYDSAATALTHNIASGNQIEMSGNGATFTLTMGTNGWYCATCHNAKSAEDAALTGTHTFFDSLAFPSSFGYVNGVSVPEGDCFGCHGDGVHDYWPQNAGNIRDDGADASYNDNGRHELHMSILATRLGYTLNTSTDAQQREMCGYCHTVEDGDHMTKGVGEDAEVFTTSLNLWGAADADAAYDEVNDRCSNVDCHASKTTLDGTYGWYNAGASTCTMCHTPGAANSPNSGLHTGVAPTTTGVKHDDTLGTGCTQCHNALPANSPGSSHVNGLFEAGNGNTAEMGLFGTYNQTADNTGTCATTCHSGAGDNGTWARKWAPTIHTASDGSECAGCHGGFDGTWNAGVLDHNQDFQGGDGAEVMGNHGTDNGAITTKDTKCLNCHVYNDTTNSAYTDATTNIGWVTNGSNTSTYHGNNKIDFDANRAYSGAGGTCGSSCHADNTGHTMGTSGWTVGSIAGAPDLACTDCHTTKAAGSAGVGTDSPHTETTSGGGFAGCQACHNGHADASSGVNDIQIATTHPTFNAKYSDHAGGKIQLGGTYTSTYSPGSEAEYCWGCHDDANPDISEWDGSSAAAKYNYGNVDNNNLNWLTTNWYSAVFSYKDGPLASAPGTQTSASTHGVMGGAAGVDAIGNIGCSACHDVHDTAAGTNGAPYLRGTWTSNPFKEDGAPGQPGSATTWTNSRDRGNVPRASASMGDAVNNEYGGWQTEDNNTYSRAGNTNHGGLCLTCHTSGEQGDITAAWGPHANVVDGFTPSGALDIFDVSYRMNTSYAEAGDVRFAYPHHLLIAANDAKKRFAFGATAGSAGYISGYRDSQEFKDSIQALADSAGKPGNGDDVANAVHVATLTGNQVDANFHQFPCSKCHNPHASRLPKLMITNCLDVQNNTWDDDKVPTSWAKTGITVGTVRYAAAELGYSSTAGNCHRYVKSTDTKLDDGQVTSPSSRASLTQGSGWNKVTPW